MVEDHESARKQTQRTETSKYLEEKKIIYDSLSSGERNGNSPNQRCLGIVGVVGPHLVLISNLEEIWKDPP